MTRRSALRSVLAGLSFLGAHGLAAGQSSARREPRRLVVRVLDEFAPLKRAIVHDASNAIDLDEDDILEFVPEERLLKYPETGPVLADQVRREVASFRKLLAKSGVGVITPE